MPSSRRGFALLCIYTPATNRTPFVGADARIGPHAGPYHMANIHGISKYLYQKCRTHTRCGICFIRFGYFAYSVARLSRITLTFIWPG